MIRSSTPRVCPSCGSAAYVDPNDEARECANRWLAGDTGYVIDALSIAHGEAAEPFYLPVAIYRELLVREQREKHVGLPPSTTYLMALRAFKRSDWVGERP